MTRGYGRWAVIAGALAVLLATSGCSKIRESVGLTKNPPDEFRVVSRAPLTIPPEFELRPPKPGAPRPQTGTPRDQAERTVFGLEDERESGPAYEGRPGMSPGEQALLAAAGADQAPDNIRRLVDRETQRLQSASRDLVDTLVFWQEPRDTAEVVNAQAEAKRLQENAALGKDVTEGKTPTIERRERGLLEGVFSGIF